ncbi:MAG TPA: hypothetical protein DEH27_04180 [Deltaproteobacteria bacterium]|nr:hypothetical protein [Deltaproteobacteria bacterium]
MMGKQIAMRFGDLANPSLLVFPCLLYRHPEILLNPVEETTGGLNRHPAVGRFGKIFPMGPDSIRQNADSVFEGVQVSPQQEQENPDQQGKRCHRHQRTVSRKEDG